MFVASFESIKLTDNFFILAKRNLLWIWNLQKYLEFILAHLKLTPQINDDCRKFRRQVLNLREMLKFYRIALSSHGIKLNCPM